MPLSQHKIDIEIPAAQLSRDVASSVTAPLFTLTEATFRVRDRTLLQPLTLSVPKGRVCGLIGHNGSGKSTLLKLLARQYAPSAGEVCFDGRALSQWSSRALARRLAYLPQQQPSANGMTVRELVSLGRYPWHGALGRFTQQDREKVDEALTLTDLHDYANRQVDLLSGGERQRAWIAMLVAQDSDCLLLDEPISALDIGHQIEVLDLVRTLSTRNGLGVIVVLHDINMAVRFCDDLIALKSGALLAKGPAVDLVEADMLGTIYGVRMGTLPHPAGGPPISFAY
ncbi:ATP-binding cassette domain-containing protein [Robbsia andropogonis]|uniref:ATP-binding cassette domain-containing protein n=1 Tax=Robbsia andropogonis TaxID=28092 RepID=UPI000466CF37|nr:ATP-binding cassette domain-containing protein [Robbsia andropogonis]